MAPSEARRVAAPRGGVDAAEQVVVGERAGVEGLAEPRPRPVAVPVEAELVDDVAAVDRHGQVPAVRLQQLRQRGGLRAGAEGTPLASGAAMLSGWPTP